MKLLWHLGTAVNQCSYSHQYNTNINDPSRFSLTSYMYKNLYQSQANVDVHVHSIFVIKGVDRNCFREIFFSLEKSLIMNIWNNEKFYSFYRVFVCEWSLKLADDLCWVTVLVHRYLSFIDTRAGFWFSSTSDFGMDPQIPRDCNQDRYTVCIPE